jgi:hypothetical protein
MLYCARKFRPRFRNCGNRQSMYSLEVHGGRALLSPRDPVTARFLTIASSLWCARDIGRASCHNKKREWDFTNNLIEVLLRLRPRGARRRRALLRCHCVVRWETCTRRSVANTHGARRSSPIRGTGHGDVVPSLLCGSRVLLSPRDRERWRRVAHQGRVRARWKTSGVWMTWRGPGACNDTFRGCSRVEVWSSVCAGAAGTLCCGERTEVRLVAPAVARAALWGSPFTTYLWGSSFSLHSTTEPLSHNSLTTKPASPSA